MASSRWVRDVALGRGARRHLVTLQEPDGPPLSNGDGGYTQPMKDMVPSQLYAEIKPATARDMERQVAGTVMSTDSLLITTDFHPDVTTKTRLTWLDAYGRSHSANVTGVTSPDQRCIDLVLTAVEVVT